MKPQLVISCHADTGFRSHRLRRTHDGDVCGHLDNYAGVFAVMLAYFSGRVDCDGVRIELTHGEEANMAGARRVLRTLSPEDTVVVVDVTGVRTSADITVEKCNDPGMQAFVRRSLRGLSYELFDGCPDPISNQDECDVYKKRLKKVAFLGIPCRGGDYNAGPVRARRQSLKAASRAIARMVKCFSGGTRQQ